jgi:DNA-directed RNA polymerase subunit L
MIHLGIIEDNHTITASLVEYFKNDEQVKVIGTADHVDKFKGEIGRASCRERVSSQV